MSYRNQTFLFTLIVLVVVTALMVWNGRVRYADYDKNQRQIMNTILVAVAQEITVLLAAQRQRVRLFAEDHMDAIAWLGQNPGDEERHERLKERVARYFPNFHTFNIANATGEMLLEDIEEDAGEVCRIELSKFAAATVQRGRKFPNLVKVHPQPFSYHFDLMIPYGYGAGGGIFFISFHLDLLTEVLRTGEVPNFQLFLLDRESPGLIELSADGTRDQLARPVNLSREELNRVEYSTIIPYTYWDLAVLPEANLLSDYRRKLRLEAIFVFVVLLAISGLMMALVGREERRRSMAEEALRDAQQQTQTQLYQRDGELRAIKRALEEERIKRQHAEQLAGKNE